jgi:hypothetical protein
MKKEKRIRNRKKTAGGPSKIPKGFLSIARRFIGGNGKPPNAKMSRRDI